MRTTRQATSLVIATALTLSVAACGGGDARPGALPTTARAVTATTSPTPSVGTTVLPPKGSPLQPTADNPLGVDWSKQAPFTGPAVDKFGAANVMAAYRHAVTFSLQEGYSDLMARGYDARPVEFSFVKPYLTPEAGKIWDVRVKEALAKDVAAEETVFLLTGWNAASGSYSFRAGQRLFTEGMRFSSATTSVFTSGAEDYLVMQFTVSRGIRVMKGGKAVLLPLERDITFRMAPNGLKDFPWLIDEWTIKSTPGLPTPDPLGATA